jgi:hypothetical protein
LYTWGAWGVSGCLVAGSCAGTEVLGVTIIQGGHKHDQRQDYSVVAHFPDGSDDAKECRLSANLAGGGIVRQCQLSVAVMQ